MNSQSLICFCALTTLGAGLVGCSKLEPTLDPAHAADAVALRVQAITSTSIDLAWNLPTGGAQDSVVVYRSAPDPAYGSLRTLADITANGTVVDQGLGLTQTSVTSGIIAGSTYLFNVVVTDTAGNITLYNPVGDYFNGTLVLYYPFSGNANDVSLSGNHGVLTNAPSLTTDRFGVSNSAYSFASGANQYIQSTSTIAITGAAPRSYSIWMKSAEQWVGGHNGVPLGWGTGVGGNLTAFGLRSPPGGNIVAWGYGSGDFDTGQALTLNWEHWVGTFDGTTFVSYKNGVRVASQLDAFNTGLSVLGVGDAPQSIGTDNTDYFIGSVDEVRIYSSALSSSSIAALYDATRP